MSENPTDLTAELVEMAQQIVASIKREHCATGTMYSRSLNKRSFGLQEPYEVAAGYLELAAESAALREEVNLSRQSIKACHDKLDAAGVFESDGTHPQLVDRVVMATARIAELEAESAAMRAALNDFCVRCAFIGMPGEPLRDQQPPVGIVLKDGSVYSPDWSKQMQAAQSSLNGTGGRDLLAERERDKRTIERLRAELKRVNDVIDSVIDSGFSPTGRDEHFSACVSPLVELRSLTESEARDA